MPHQMPSLKRCQIIYHANTTPNQHHCSNHRTSDLSDSTTTPDAKSSPPRRIECENAKDRSHSTTVPPLYPTQSG